MERRAFAGGEYDRQGVGENRVDHELGLKLFGKSAQGLTSADFPENTFTIKVAVSASEVQKGAKVSVAMQVWMRDDWEFHNFLSRFART